MKAATYLDGKKNMLNISKGDEKLQYDVRKLLKQCPTIDYEFSVLSELVSYPEPCKTDIRRAKITLAMVNWLRSRARRGEIVAGRRGGWT